MKEGDLVLTPLPQGDGQVKNRPAVVLRVMPGYGDLLVCGVSTQVHQAVGGFDELIKPEDVDVAGSGLRSASVIRLGFLATLPVSAFHRVDRRDRWRSAPSAPREAIPLSLASRQSGLIAFGGHAVRGTSQAPSLRRS